jgi:hypothetical protein
MASHGRRICKAVHSYEREHRAKVINLRLSSVANGEMVRAAVTEEDDGGNFCMKSCMLHYLPTVLLLQRRAVSQRTNAIRLPPSSARTLEIFSGKN